MGPMGPMGPKGDPGSIGPIPENLKVSSLSIGDYMFGPQNTSGDIPITRKGIASPPEQGIIIGVNKTTGNGYLYGGSVGRKGGWV